VVAGEAAGPVRVIVGEQELAVRGYLEGMLATAAGIEVVAVCATAGELRAAIAEHDANVVVTGLFYPLAGVSEGVAVVEQLRTSKHPVGVVVLTKYLDPELVLAVLGPGTTGHAYLLKDTVQNDQQLLTAIHTVAQGGSLIDPRAFDVLITARNQTARSKLNALTARELEILAEIAAGKGNHAIAQTLVLSLRAVEKHINSIFSKLDLTGNKQISPRVVATRMYLAHQTHTHHPTNPNQRTSAHRL
jgi:DNA-binding NarL/FixJ family response regulator